MTDLSGYAKKSTANGDTRSSFRRRLRLVGLVVLWTGVKTDVDWAMLEGRSPR